MKRYAITSQTSDQMIGHLIKPTSSLKTKAHNVTERSIAGQLKEEASCYRLEKCLSQAVGNRTFLATDICSNSKVIVKLLLYCPDPQKKEIEKALKHLTAAGLEPDQLPVTLPYIESFEAETRLGPALALVKPYVQSVAQPSRSASRCQAARSQQMTPPLQAAYTDFKVSAVSNKLFIQCLESRICEGSVSENARESLENSLLAVVGTIIFVGGTVATTGSVMLGIFVAALLPILFRYITNSKREQRMKSQAIIRLSQESRGRTFLSLTTALKPRWSSVSQAHAPLIESQLHYSRLSVKEVTVTSAFFFFFNGWNLLGAKLTFTFYNHDAPSSRLCVVGSYQEIRWIQRHLLRWAKADSSNLQT